MAKTPNYKKDPETGAIIFQDATAYVQRKKVIVSTKLAKKVQKDSKLTINSMKREIKALKKQVASSSALEQRLQKLEQNASVPSEGDN
jgi:prefoldin subunit 5|tara:strand:+ start:2162 stop:2425 length:264 start_codon:yes stop_codon:yes gene_type:complete